MSFFKRTKSELFEGGPKVLAPIIQEMRAYLPSPVEREFDQKWAAELARRVQSGMALPFVWAVADMPLEGGQTRLRMNGNHSSWALERLLSEGKLPEKLAIHRDTYWVPDQDGAVLLFRQFDDRNSSRSAGDVAGAYQCFHDAIRDCPRKSAKRAVDGVAWYRWHVQGLGVHSGDERYSLFNEVRLHPYVRMVSGILDSKCRELDRTAIAAAMYGTWLADSGRAGEFWRFTAMGSKRNVDDAPAQLDGELTRLKEEKEKVKDAELFLKCAKAWFAYLDGAAVANFRVSAKKGLPDLAA